MKNFDPESKLAEILDEDERSTFHLGFIKYKSVLGIDIYKYSDYPESIQVYVPVLFNSLYKVTVLNCINEDKYFFQKYGDTLEEFKEKFISTGDGGFQIFDDPMQSLIFAAYFQLNVTRFNSGSLTTNLNINLFNIVGRIELRYATTFDKIYSYDKNFFGPAIINNVRILSKDSLNRLLIDFPTLKWFNLNINAIENLLLLNKGDFSNIPYFKDYNSKIKSLLFEKGNGDKIKTVDVLKIGAIKSKNSLLEIYNLKIQVHINIPTRKKSFAGFLVTVGNLNTKGIE